MAGHQWFLVFVDNQYVSHFVVYSLNKLLVTERSGFPGNGLLAKVMERF
jgi:hypothetical protein